MSERIRGGYDDALYKSTFTLLYFTLMTDSKKALSRLGALSAAAAAVT